jgi:hypothetical protein
MKTAEVMAVKCGRNAFNMKSTAFRYVMPCSVVEVYRRFGGTYSLHFQEGTAFILRITMQAKPASCKYIALLSALFLAYSSVLKLEAVGSSETR